MKLSTHVGPKYCKISYKYVNYCWQFQITAVSVTTTQPYFDSETSFYCRKRYPKNYTKMHICSCRFANSFSLKDDIHARIRHSWISRSLPDNQCVILQTRVNCHLITKLKILRSSPKILHIYYKHSQLTYFHNKNWKQLSVGNEEFWSHYLNENFVEMSCMRYPSSHSLHCIYNITLKS